MTLAITWRQICDNPLPNLMNNHSIDAHVRKQELAIAS